MFEKFIQCVSCEKRYNKDEMIFRCESCGSNLEIIFDYRKLKGIRNKIESRPFYYSRYRELFPVKEIISLGEGFTPIIRSKNMEKKLKLPFELYFKPELLNPTGSFKDRGSSVEVAKAMEKGFSKVVVASTGNMGASIAAYSAAAGIKCRVLVPRDANEFKMRQILSYGARVERIRKDYSDVIEHAERMAGKGGYFLLGDYLHRREGTKSIGLEISEQMKADYVFLPVGNGILISAVWKGIKEANFLGLSHARPKLAGVQAAGCCPFFRAWKYGKLEKIKKPRTIADAIECDFPLDGLNALRSLKESGGLADIVSDKELLEARDMLARMEGLSVEPSAAAGLAGLLKAKEVVKENSRVLCIVTGHGLKEPVV